MGFNLNLYFSQIFILNKKFIIFQSLLFAKLGKGSFYKKLPQGRGCSSPRRQWSHGAKHSTSQSAPCTIQSIKSYYISCSLTCNEDIGIYKQVKSQTKGERGIFPHCKKENETQ